VLLASLDGEVHDDKAEGGRVFECVWVPWSAWFWIEEEKKWVADRDGLLCY
jgi:hypothetical protein